MKNYRAKLTTKIFDLAYRFPYLFKKTTRQLAKNYHSKSLMVNEKKNKLVDKKGSILDSDFVWKALSFSIIVSNHELRKIKNWQEKNSVHTYNNRFDIFSREFSLFDRSNGSANLGTIKINKETFMDDLNSIYMDSKYLDSVFLSLSRYPAGLSILTFYICLKKDATDVVNSVFLPSMRDFFELNSFNPFSRKLNSVSILRDEDLYKKFLNEKMNDVLQESKRLLKIIKNDIGFSKNESEIFCMSDFYINQEPPYFKGITNPVKKQEFILTPSRRDFFVCDFTSDIEDSFSIDPYLNINNIDMTYFKVCPESSFNDWNNFKLNYYTNQHSHLAPVPLFILVKKIDKLSKAINELPLYNKKVSMARLHKELFVVIHELNLIDGWLKALHKELKFSLLEGYKDEIDKMIVAQISRVNELQGVIKSFYNLSENRIQVSNVRYNQIYSLVVFLFIIIQVFLASMTIDWSKDNAWYSSLVIFLKNIF